MRNAFADGELHGLSRGAFRVTFPVPGHSDGPSTRSRELTESERGSGESVGLLI